MLQYNNADGQYLASKLSKSITKQSSQLKQLLKKFISLHNADVLTWADATDLSSSQWCGGAFDHHVPKKLQLNAIKYHHLVLRSDEEIELIELKCGQLYHSIIGTGKS